MPRRRFLLVFVLIVAGVVNLFGTNCGTVGVSVCWWTPIFQGSQVVNPYPATCPQGTNACGGYYMNTGGTGVSSLNGTNGWHYFDPNANTPQGYLNSFTSTSGLTFSLSSTSSLYIGGSFGTHYPPSNDSGYYLSTADSTTTPGLSIGFSKPIKQFAMYWGSVDPWNTIIFTDAYTCTYNSNTNTTSCVTCTQNCTHTVSGSQALALCTASSGCPSAGNGNNTASILVNFSVPSSTHNTNSPWSNVAFSSCDSSGVCKPAFEFDNIEWVVAPSNCCSPTGSGSPVPESSNLMLLGTGIAAVAGWLRRRVRL